MNNSSKVSHQKFNTNSQKDYSKEFSHYHYYCSTKDFSSLFKLLNTTKSIMIFKTRPIMMLMSAYSARKEMMVVKAPGPAISGKAIGTTLLPLPFASFLNISTPSIISNAMMNKIIEPATAKDSISTEKKFSNPVPAKKNIKNNPRETRQACVAENFLPLPCKEIKIGIEPIISMIANKTMNVLMISTKFIPMFFLFRS